jgi:hypothetical protein
MSDMDDKTCRGSARIADGHGTGIRGIVRPALATGSYQKNFVISDFVFVTIRQVSFNIHPWLYVKFM